MKRSFDFVGLDPARQFIYRSSMECFDRAIALGLQPAMAWGSGTAYTDLNMPNETRNYVPKLQAVKNIIASPEAFRTELPLIENHPYFQTVEITRDIDVALAARLADVAEARGLSLALNPSANRPVITARRYRKPSALGQCNGLPAQLRSAQQRPIRKLDRSGRHPAP